MDPQLKSVVTSVLGGLAVAIATWAAAKGVIPGTQVNDLSNILVTVALGAGTLFVGWYKQRQETPAANIKKVNAAENGVKVVPESVPAPPVDKPLKGPGA